MFGLSGVELLIVLAIALLLFGTRVPRLARSLGQAKREFEEGLRDRPDEADDEAPEPPAKKRSARRSRD